MVVCQTNRTLCVKSLLGESDGSTLSVLTPIQNLVKKTVDKLPETKIHGFFGSSSKIRSKTVRSGILNLR